MDSISDLIKPLVIYGGGLLVFIVFQIVVFGPEHTSLLLLPILVMPIWLGSIIHKKLSRFGYFGGALSGLLISIASICFLAGWHYIDITLRHPNWLLSPEGFALIILAYGAMIAIPVGIVLGCIYHHLFIEN